MAVVKLFDLKMTGNHMRNVELPIILTSLTLDYGYTIYQTDSAALRRLNVGEEFTFNPEGIMIPSCVIRRVK